MCQFVYQFTFSWRPFGLFLFNFFIDWFQKERKGEREKHQSMYGRTMIQPTKPTKPPGQGWLVVLFKKDFIYLFLERGEGKEKERKRNSNVWLPLACLLLGTWPAVQACALTGNWTSDPLVCRPALNPLRYTSEGW